jgi:hypothetical protein
MRVRMGRAAQATHLFFRKRIGADWLLGSRGLQRKGDGWNASGADFSEEQVKEGRAAAGESIWVNTGGTTSSQNQGTHMWWSRSRLSGSNL